MSTKLYKIYADSHVELASYSKYKKWLKENLSLYNIGPHFTEDKREIYTTFSANSLEASCFTTFEVFLGNAASGQKSNIYKSPDWISARELHKKLLNPKTAIKKARSLSIQPAILSARQIGLR